ncbi:hypothetical protein HDU93_004073, partial [Gonapodya sp. JEL0774]
KTSGSLSAYDSVDFKSSISIGPEWDLLFQVVVTEGNPSAIRFRLMNQIDPPLDSDYGLPVVFRASDPRRFVGNYLIRLTNLEFSNISYELWVETIPSTVFNPGRPPTFDVGAFVAGSSEQMIPPSQSHADAVTESQHQTGTTRRSGEDSNIVRSAHVGPFERLDDLQDVFQPLSVEHIEPPDGPPILAASVLILLPGALDYMAHDLLPPMAVATTYFEEELADPAKASSAPDGDNTVPWYRRILKFR